MEHPQLGKQSGFKISINGATYKSSKYINYIGEYHGNSSSCFIHDVLPFWEATNRFSYIFLLNILKRELQKVNMTHMSHSAQVNCHALCQQCHSSSDWLCMFGSPTKTHGILLQPILYTNLLKSLSSLLGPHGRLSRHKLCGIHCIK